MAEGVVHVEPRGDERAEIRQEDEAVGVRERVARGMPELLEVRDPVGEAQIHVFQPGMRRGALAEAVGVGRETVGEDAVVLGGANAVEAIADPVRGEAGDRRAVGVADVHDVPVPLRLVDALAVRGQEKPVGLRIHEGPIGAPFVADDEGGRARADAELVVQAEEVGVVDAERLDFGLQHLLGAGEMRGGEPTLRGVQAVGQLVGEGDDALAGVGPRASGVGQGWPDQD